MWVTPGCQSIFQSDTGTGAVELVLRTDVRRQVELLDGVGEDEGSRPHVEVRATDVGAVHPEGLLVAQRDRVLGQGVFVQDVRAEVHVDAGTVDVLQVDAFDDVELDQLTQFVVGNEAHSVLSLLHVVMHADDDDRRGSERGHGTV